MTQEAQKYDPKNLFHCALRRCTACDEFDLVFGEVANEFPDVGFFKFDAGADPQFAAPHTEGEVPALVLYRQEELVSRAVAPFTPSNYGEHLSLQLANVVNWVRHYTGDAVVWLPDLIEVPDKMGRTAVIASFLEKGHDKAREVYANFADAHRAFGKFFGRISRNRIGDVFGVFVKIIHNVVAFNDISKPVDPTLIELYEVEITEEVTFGEELQRFLEKHQFPMFGQLDMDNQHRYYSTGKDPAILFGDFETFKRLRPMMMSLAPLFKDEINFVWFRVETEEEHRTMYSLRDCDIYFEKRLICNYGGTACLYEVCPSPDSMDILRAPQLLVIKGTGRMRDHKKYMFPANATLEDKDAVRAFIEKVINNEVSPILSVALHLLHRLCTIQARPLVRSNPNLPPDRVIKPEYVKFVTGDTFEEDVVSKEEDALVILTAPAGGDYVGGCTGCERLVLEFETVAKELQSACDGKRCPIRIAELMVTQNEPPFEGWTDGWELSDLPVIAYVRKGSTVPTFYKNNTSPLSVITWWTKLTEFDAPIQRAVVKAAQNVPARDEL